jgi:hypothetical protein
MRILLKAGKFQAVSGGSSTLMAPRGTVGPVVVDAQIRFAGGIQITVHTFYRFL